MKCRYQYSQKGTSSTSAIHRRVYYPIPVTKGLDFENHPHAMGWQYSSSLFITYSSYLRFCANPVQTSMVILCKAQSDSVSAKCIELAVANKTQIGLHDQPVGQTSRANTDALSKQDWQELARKIPTIPYPNEA